MIKYLSIIWIVLEAHPLTPVPTCWNINTGWDAASSVLPCPSAESVLAPIWQVLDWVSSKAQSSFSQLRFYELMWLVLVFRYITGLSRTKNCSFDTFRGWRFLVISWPYLTSSWSSYILSIQKYYWSSDFKLLLDYSYPKDLKRAVKIFGE